jgi:hypothetical protein
MTDALKATSDPVKKDSETVTKEEALAKELAKPIASSAERSKKPGNTHPVKPEDREDTLSGNTATTDELAALEGEKNRINDRIKTVKETKDRLENTELYKRDLEVLKLAKQGNLPGQNTGKTATELEEPRAKVELDQLKKLENQIKDSDKK